jgi:trans-aconitate 2-methyltransferase
VSAARSLDWDAATYDRVAVPQLVWANEQVDRLELRGDEVVVDAGCGTGKVTSLLLDRLPRGRVYAVDLAPSMVEFARGALPADRAVVVEQDLVELSLPDPVDGVFSNATFHWIPDHDALFGALHRALKPGGRLVAQCGGRGNIDEFRRAADSVAAEEPFEHFFDGWQKPWNYATAEETAERLERAGFAEVSCWLEPRPVTPTDPTAFARTVCLVRHLDPLPAGLREPFIDRVLKRAGEPLVLDYVRLNMTARKP